MKCYIIIYCGGSNQEHSATVYAENGDAAEEKIKKVIVNAVVICIHEVVSLLVIP